MAFIRVSSPECDIWEDNPALALISEFKDFKASEGDERSSNILKAIFYIYDPKSSLRDSGIPAEKLIEDVTKGIIKDEEFSWDNYGEILAHYLNFNISKLESMLLHYEKQLTDLNRILDGWVASKETIGEKSKLIKLYKELWEDYLSVKAQVDTEWTQEEEFYAGYTKSKLEKYGSERT